MRNIAILFVLLGLSNLVFACPTGGEGLKKAEIKKLQKTLSQTKTRRDVANVFDLPSFGVGGWGGAPANWKPEATLANVLSGALNEGWRQPHAIDVIASAPLQMLFTNQRPYGDGQTNAGVSLGTWLPKDLPLIALLVTFPGGKRDLQIRVAPQILIPSGKIKAVTYPTRKGLLVRQDLEIHVSHTPQGSYGSVTLPADLVFGNLEMNHLIWIESSDWAFAFPVDFRMPTFTVNELAAATTGARTLQRSPLDPASVSFRSQSARQISEQILLASAYGPEWYHDDHGSAVLRNEPIHGQIQTAAGVVPTAVGGGLTWFIPKGPNSNFKNLYTCFDQRNPTKESAAGVPSGGGWHEIGDAAETIINNLEQLPIPVGFASGKPFPSPPDGKIFFQNFTDVASLRLLRPGEAMMTPAGDQTWTEDIPWRASGNGSVRGRDPSAAAGRNYHWFLFPFAMPVCTQEWVHNCRPTIANGYGLSCP